MGEEEGGTNRESNVEMRTLPCVKQIGSGNSLCDAGFPGGSAGKKFACKAGDPGSIPGLGRSPGRGHSNPLQYSGLENSMERGAWWATVHGVAKSQKKLRD